uniref:uncharacterized protein LOC106997435 n=1 Tax=Macaca mulatta TaxID=9544 RepID=UPI0010A21F6E|nr:uncharacterized protein LOC106997435 [Macaca mulatta]
MRPSPPRPTCLLPLPRNLQDRVTQVQSLGAPGHFPSQHWDLQPPPRLEIPRPLTGDHGRDSHLNNKTAEQRIHISQIHQRIAVIQHMLPPNQRDRQVDTENHSSLEQRLLLEPHGKEHGKGNELGIEGNSFSSSSVESSTEVLRSTHSTVRKTAAGGQLGPSLLQELTPSQGLPCLLPQGSRALILGCKTSTQSCQPGLSGHLGSRVGTEWTEQRH